MTASILAIVAGIVAIIVWWVKNNPDVSRRDKISEIRTLEDALDAALAKSDMDTVAACIKRLRELRQKNT